MNFKELKESLKKIEPVKQKKKKSRILEETTGYYTLPCSREPFEGEVIKLSGDEFYVMFQKYSVNGDEFKFRENLEKKDYWLSTKPTRVYNGWLRYVTRWLQKEQENA